MLNSLLTIPKSKTNGFWVNGSFGTIVVSVLNEKGYRLISVTPNNITKKDVIVVQMGTFTGAEMKTLTIGGNNSAIDILKKLEK